jgi:type IV secretion system protein VirB1
LGLAQINSENLSALGLTVEQVLDPCTNLRAGAAILSEGYARAMKVHGPGQQALQAALSAYNTGTLTRGFSNGYVAKYYGPVPALSIATEGKQAQNPYQGKAAVYWPGVQHADAW